MKNFDGLEGDKLEEWFEGLLKSELGFKKYYPSPGQIKLTDLDPSQDSGHHLEIDGILIIHRTCILLEYSAEGGGFKNKIKKFTRNCNLFINSEHISIREKFELFNVPEEELDDCEDVENWKILYLGTHKDFEGKNYSKEDFPDYPLIQESLYIFEPSQIEYLRQLANLIGEYAQNELLAILNFSPSDIGDDEESIKLPFIKADGKYITSKKSIRADIYLLKIKVNKLLRIARVSRYEGIPFILDEDNNKESYQRLLIKNKLTNISNNFIKNESKKTFPNTITIVLSNKCQEVVVGDEIKLEIPKDFSSIDIIDGQHRLYGYIHKDISEEVRNNAEILASAIKFRNTEEQKVTQDAAKVFVEINANQAKVKKELIYLIKYDVLKETDEIALSGKILLECDKKKRKVLGNMFKTSSLKRKNKLNLTPIPITTIVDSDLEPFLKGLGIDDYKATDEDFEQVFEHSVEYYSTKPAQFYKKNVSIIENYFSMVKQTFTYDWKEDAETYLISSKYFSAFIRLLRFQLYNKGKSLNDMTTVIQSVKDDVDQITNPYESPSFPRGNQNIPTTKHGINTIFEFLKNTSSFDPNN